MQFYIIFNTAILKIGDSMKKIIIKTLITTFILGALIGIIAVIFDLWNDVTEKILLSIIVLFGFSISGLASSTAYEKAKDKFIPIVGLIITIISVIYFELVVWEITIFKLTSDLAWQLPIILILLSVSSGHISLLMLISSEEDVVKMSKMGTIVVSLIMDALFINNIVSDLNISWKVITVIGILVILGTIITPLLNILNKKKEQPKEEDDKYKRIEQLKSLLDTNAITQEEYDVEKNKLLNETDK
jgi:hypothetical protein